jgi:hypothetical protein
LGEDEIKQAHDNLKTLVPPNVGVLTVLGKTEIDEIPLQLGALEKGKTEEVQSDVLMSAGVGEGALKGGNFSTGVLNIEVLTNTLVKILKQVENLWFNRKFKQLISTGTYQFKLKFLGITSLNKDKIITAFDGLLDKGGNVTLSINARDMDVADYINILDIENALGYKDKFSPLLTSYTATEGGRPSGTGKGSDNTDKSNESGSNNSPRPSTQ